LKATSQTLYRIGSLTKPITATLALGWFHHQVHDTDIYWHTGVLAGHFA